MKALVACAMALWLSGAGMAAPVGQEITKLLEGSPAASRAFWGIQIVNLTKSESVFSLNADRLFVPASNAKLFTAALALERLGPDFRFQTRVLADAGPGAAGQIQGPLRLVGGGDPNLSARPVPYRVGPATGNPLAAIEDLADQIVAHGVKRVTGGIIGDDTWYVWEPYPEGWAVDDTEYDYGAPVSALTLNDNTFALAVQPAARVAELANISLTPPLEYYAIDNRVETVAAGEAKLHVDRQVGRRQLKIWGVLPLHAPAESMVLAIDDPAEYAARALRQALENRGVPVAGEISAHHRFPNEEGLPDEPVGFELARRDSAPLIDDLGITAKVSQNLHAELALRAVARARRNVGSRQAGLEEMKQYLGELGIGAEAYSFHDGSGLDRSDLVTPRAIVQLLEHMYASPFRDSWIGLLPIGGLDGTLSARFLDGPAAGRIHAKTGTLSHVTSLSGYIERPDGDWLAFSILVNNHNGPAEVGSIVDRICTLILE
jgi:serine-type D-Ala-D-Ala carboxypeptidase/endopeptidase (penicillin-binding protein 4)